MTPVSAPGDYAPIAPYYDRYTHDPRFHDWVLRCVALGTGTGTAGRALDVGCGTGRTTRPLLELGYDVTGIDPSAAMLCCAADSLAGAATLVRCGAGEAAPDDLGRFDLAVWLNDGCNHVRTSAELRAAFAAVASCLSPGGTLILDANRRGIFDTVFTADHTRVSDDLTFLWRGRGGIGRDGRRLARASLEVRRTGTDRTLAEFEHVQRYHPDRRIRALLADAGLRVAAVHGFDNDGQIAATLAPASPKALYIAHRPSSPTEERRCHAQDHPRRAAGHADPLAHQAGLNSPSSRPPRRPGTAVPGAVR